MGLREWLGISARDAPNVTDSVRDSGQTFVFGKAESGETVEVNVLLEVRNAPTPPPAPFLVAFRIASNHAIPTDARERRPWRRRRRGAWEDGFSRRIIANVEWRKSQTAGQFGRTSRVIVCGSVTGFHETLYLQAFRERRGVAISQPGHHQGSSKRPWTPRTTK